MLTTKRINKRLMDYKEKNKNRTIKGQCLHYSIPYEFVLCYKTEEERIRFIMKVLLYRETNVTKNKKVIEANEYYVKYKI